MNKEHWNTLARKYKCDLRRVGHEKSSLKVNIYFDMLFRRAIFNAIRELKISLNSKRVLDIGCGTGRWTYLISNIGAEVVGIDISPEMIKNAESLRKNKQNPIFVEASASKLPFPANYFELILSVTVLQHILDETEIQDACREILRVLKPFGYTIVLEETSKTGKVSNTTFARKVDVYSSLFGNNDKLILRKGIDAPLRFQKFVIKFNLSKFHYLISNLPFLREKSRHSLMAFQKVPL